jgi:hypothetical protein
MIFEYGQYSKYRDIANKMRKVLLQFLPEANIDMSQKKITLGNLTMNSEI